MDQVLVSGYQGWHFSGGNLQGNYWLADEVAALLSQYQHRNLPVVEHCAGKTGIACIRAVLPEYFIAVGRRLWSDGGHEQQRRRVEHIEVAALVGECPRQIRDQSTSQDAGHGVPPNVSRQLRVSLQLG